MLDSNRKRYGVLLDPMKQSLSTTDRWAGLGIDSLDALELDVFSELRIEFASMTDSEKSKARSMPGVLDVVEDGVVEALPIDEIRTDARSAGHHLLKFDPVVPMLNEIPTMSAPNDWAIRMVRADLAWRNGVGDGVRVAVLDTGVDSDHPGLAGRVEKGCSFLPGTLPGDTTDPSGHGTLSAGLVAGYWPEKKVFGVAPNCSIVPVKVLSALGVGSANALVKGLMWVASEGIPIVSISVGTKEAHAAAIIEHAAKQLASRGCIVVAAAGNDGVASELPGGQLSLLAATDEVIAVGAVDANGARMQISAYSQNELRRSRAVELVAPGERVPSLRPNGEMGYAFNTSAACPLVAGAAALALSRLPEGESICTVRKQLRDYAHDVLPEGHDPPSGYGLLDCEHL